jgi:hypothetical protein
VNFHRGDGGCEFSGREGSVNFQKGEEGCEFSKGGRGL